MVKTIGEIDREIAYLQQKLNEVKGTPTEVYTRIVGYHRNVDNWNKGKREEYKYRKPFVVDEMQIEEKKVFGMHDQKKDAVRSGSDNEKEHGDLDRISHYKVFTSQFCRNCPPVKDYVKKLSFEGEEIDVSTDLGISMSKKYNIMSTPTVLFFDDQGNIIFEAHTVSELKEISISEKVLA